MNPKHWLHALASAVLLVLPLVTQADYVADNNEIAAMKAKILKNPPTTATLTAAPYPGSKLDAECSADQSASNQPETMVYCLYTLDPLDKVKAYLSGPGKPGGGVWAIADTDDVVEGGWVKVAGVTQVRYFVSAKKKAAAAQAASNPSPAPAPTPAAQPVAAQGAVAAAPSQSTPTASENTKQDEKADVSDMAGKAAETANKLKGLFGH